MKRELLLQNLKDIINDMTEIEYINLESLVLKAGSRIAVKRFKRQKFLNEVKENIEMKSLENQHKQNEIIAYVDGSFDKDRGLCGSGIVFLKNKNQLVPNLTKSFNTYDKYNMWNIQGECEACLKAIRMAVNFGLNKIIIHYDYQGIESWVKKIGNKREWKAKNDYTKGYVKQFDELNKKIDIEFVKVKGHSGDKWNDEADRLARESLGK